MSAQSHDGKKAILLVEDEDADSEIIELHLKRSCIANPVYRARDGLEALEMLKEMAADEKLGRPFLVLVDIYMPRMNGLELLELIRRDEALKHNMVFILTTSDWVHDKLRACDLDVAGYIMKDRMHDLTGFVSHCTIKTLIKDARKIFNERAGPALARAL